MNECLNNYTNDQIETYFGESEESMKKCNNCPHLKYEDGTITCDKLNKEGE